MFRGLNSQDAWLAIDVEELIHHEVLALINETLSHFPDLSFHWIFKIYHLDVFSASNLFLFLNLLTFLKELRDIWINERIIFTHLTDTIVKTGITLQIIFVELKEFLLDILWDLNIVSLVVRYKEILHYMGWWRWQTYEV